MSNQNLKLVIKNDFFFGITLILTGNVMNFCYVAVFPTVFYSDVKNKHEIAINQPK